jgi:hypothetical protein
LHHILVYIHYNHNFNKINTLFSLVTFLVFIITFDITILPVDYGILYILLRAGSLIQYWLQYLLSVVWIDHLTEIKTTILIHFLRYITELRRVEFTQAWYDLSYSYVFDLVKWTGQLYCFVEDLDSMFYKERTLVWMEDLLNEFYSWLSWSFG